MRQIPQYVIGQVDPIGFINVPDGIEVVTHPKIEPILGKVEMVLTISDWTEKMPDVVRINGVEYRP